MNDSYTPFVILSEIGQCEVIKWKDVLNMICVTEESKKDLIK